MAALSADVFNLSTPARRETDTFPVENSENLYINGLVGLDANGYLDAWEDEAGMKFLGLFKGYTPKITDDGIVAAAGDTGNSPVIRGIVDVSGRKLAHVDVAGVSAQSSVNSLVHCATDNYADLSLTAGSNTRAIGWLSYFRSATDMDVILFTPQEYLAFNNLGASITALTDNSGGTADDTIADITEANNSGSADRVPTENAIADLAAKVNAIIAAIGL